MILISFVGLAANESGLRLWSLWGSYCLYLQFKARGLFHAVKLQHKTFTNACSPVQMTRTQNHLPTLNFEAAIYDPRYWGRTFSSKSGKRRHRNEYFAKNGRSQFNGHNSLYL